MEIVTSGICIQIEDFTRKVESFFEFGFQGLGIDFGELHSAGGDHAAFEADIGGYVYLPMLEG